MNETLTMVSDRSDLCRKDNSSYRRSNKPLMEKRRRARINNCLVQLKSLVLQAMRKDNAQYSKLEKADILEMTVKHLRQLQRHHAAVAVTSDPGLISKYRVGFNECANEVVRYLQHIDGVGDSIRTRLLNHLAGCMETSNYVSKPDLHGNAPCHQRPQNAPCQQPLQVIVPQHENRRARTMSPAQCRAFSGRNGQLLVPADELSVSECTGGRTSDLSFSVAAAEQCPRLPENQNFARHVTLECSEGQSISPVSASRAPASNMTRFTDAYASQLNVGQQLLKQQAFMEYDNSDRTFRQDGKQRHLRDIPCDFDYRPLHCGSSRTPSPLELSTDKVWRPW